MKTLLIFGHGYVAKHLAKRLHSDQIKVFVTTRQSIDQQPDYATLINFYSQEVSDLIKSSDFILSTAAPQTNDPILQQHQLALKQFQGTWIVIYHQLVCMVIMKVDGLMKILKNNIS